MNPLKLSLEDVQSGLESLSNIYSDAARSTRLLILSSRKDDPVVEWYFTTMFKPFQTFGIKLNAKDINIIDKKVSYIPDVREVLSDFQKLIVRLAERSLTGGLARTNLVDIISKAGQHRHLLVNLINKETPEGINFGSIQSVWPDKVTKPFACGTCRGSFDNAFKEGSKWVAQQKFWGMRVLIGKFDGKYKVFTRNFNELNLNNFRFVIQSLEDIQILDDYVVDGEVDVGEQFQSIGLCKTKGDLSEENAMRIQFIAFDAIPKSEFLAQEGKSTLGERLEILRQYLVNNETPYLRIAETFHVENKNHALDVYNHFVNNGKEGIVIKDLGMPYVFGDNPSWVKLKLEDNYDGIILECIEGNGRLEGTLGAIVCDFKGRQCRIGGGMSDSKRAELWAMKDDIIGCGIEFKANGLTPDGSPNHGVFVMLREDKSE